MVNFNELERMSSLSKQHEIDMDQWFTNQSRTESICGTSGCLLGTWLIYSPTIFPNIIEPYHINRYASKIADFLGLTEHEFEWLFDKRVYIHNSSIRGRNLYQTSGKDAVSRLDKFISYKKQKSGLFSYWNNRLHTRNLECRIQLSIAT